jgi:Pyridoxamine 5'-phosphate oxidase
MGKPVNVMSEDRCWQLLATVSVGRLALSVRALPVILPVWYYLEGRSLAVCLGHRGIPDRSLNQAIIAFSADSIDPVTRSGWSVQVQGKSVIPPEHHFETDCGLPSMGQVVQIQVATISGFQVIMCPYIDNLHAAAT